MCKQILDNIKAYLTETNEETWGGYECTNSDYTNAKISKIEEVMNYIADDKNHLFEIKKVNIYEV